MDIDLLKKAIEQQEQTVEGYESSMLWAEQDKQISYLIQLRKEKKVDQEKLEALQLALEVSEGKAHVMRWVEVDNNALPKLEDTESPYLVELLEPQTRYTIDTSDNYYATFNGSPEIPMPKEEE